MQSSPGIVSSTPASVAEATQTLLTRFAVALNRRRAYRSSHPMVASAEQQLLETIANVMSTRETLILGVGPRELLWDGKRVRSRLSITREVAARLHRRGISALTFQEGITLESVRLLLGWLTGDAAVVAAIVTSSGTGIPEIPGFQIARIPYDELILADSVEANEEQVAAIWTALGTVALGARRTASGQLHAATNDETLTADDMVAAIRNGADDPDYMQRISGMLFTLVDQAAHATPKQRLAIGERLKSVFTKLDTQSLSAIFRHLGNAEQQRMFVSQVTESLPVNAVVEWLEITAHTGGRDLSQHLLRLLRKLATLSIDLPTAAATDTGFRDAALDLVSGWDLDDPNPLEHVELLDQIGLIESSRGPTQETASPLEYGSEKQGECARLVQMALELDGAGADACAAVTQLMMEGRAAELLQWINAAGGGNARAQLLTVAASPDMLKAVMLRHTPDANVLRALLVAARDDAIPVLFDVLAVSEARVIRRLVYDRLRDFGPVIWKELTPRLEGSTWYFARNLLTLMRDVRVAVRQAGGDTGALPLIGVPRFLNHAREVLRLEAVRLLLDDPSTRDGTLRRALDDVSSRIVREALEWLIAEAENRQPPAHNNLRSPELFDRIVQLIDNTQLPDEVRARAVWALDSQVELVTRDWLIAHVTRKKFLTRRMVLAEGRPTTLAALGLLAKRFHDDVQAATVLTMARATNDMRSQAASGGPARPGNG